MADDIPKITVREVQKLWEESRRVSWSRIQTASALEVATLGGAYTVGQDGHLGLACGILFLGALFMFGLFLVMLRDVRHGDAFREFLKHEKKMFDFGRHLFGIKTQNVVLWVPVVLIAVNVVSAIWVWYVAF